MRLKVHDGTAPNGDSSLCTSCRLSTVVRGRTLDEEIVVCHALSMQARRVTFKVTSCTSYRDARLPSYLELLEVAWILQPGSRKRQAGFVRGADLRPEQLSEIAMDIHRLEDE